MTARAERQVSMNCGRTAAGLDQPLISPRGRARTADIQLTAPLSMTSPGRAISIVAENDEKIAKRAEAEGTSVLSPPSPLIVRSKTHELPHRTAEPGLLPGMVDDRMQPT